MKQYIKGFKNSQKIRVFVNQVGFYMTVGDVASKFVMTSHREAVEMTLHLMANEGCGGVSHTVKSFDPMMRSQNVSVQVDLI